MEHLRRGVAPERPQPREQLSDHARDDAAVAADVLQIEQAQGARPPRVRCHPLRHPVDRAADDLARRGREAVEVLEERLGVGEEIALAVGDAGRKRGAKCVHLRGRRPLGEELAEGAELPLLQPRVGEGGVLDGIEQAEEQVRERDPRPERQLELRDAEGEVRLTASR